VLRGKVMLRKAIDRRPIVDRQDKDPFVGVRVAGFDRQSAFSCWTARLVAHRPRVSILVRPIGKVTFCKSVTTIRIRFSLIVTGPGCAPYRIWVKAVGIQASISRWTRNERLERQDHR
jgi:hypothetical protein